MATTTDRPFNGDELIGRVFEQTVGAFEALNMYIGERLGLYRSLADGGPATAGELAGRAGIAPRYAREWLEQQTVAGVLEVDDIALDAETRRYAIPPEHREPLLDEESLAYVAFMPRFIASVGQTMPALLDAFRTGGGVPWDAYGADGREAQGSANRVLTKRVVGQEWLKSIPDLDARLSSDPPALVADICCGEGWLTIGLATAYPRIHVIGLDADEASLDAARRHAADAGVADRVEFEEADVTRLGPGEAFDLAMMFEALHDLSRPVEALRGARERLTAGGSMIVVDERTADAFTGLARDNSIERFFYAVSTTVCLPGGLVERPSAGTGTVIRASTVDRYAHEAGFGSVEILPIEHEMFRAYRMRT